MPATALNVRELCVAHRPELQSMSERAPQLAPSYAAMRVAKLVVVLQVSNRVSPDMLAVHRYQRSLRTPRPAQSERPLPVAAVLSQAKVPKPEIGVAPEQSSFA